MIIPNLFRRIFFRKIIKTTTMDVIRNPNATLVDLRNEFERDEYGIIERAKWIPIHEVPKRIEEFKAFPKPIAVFCKEGGRANQTLAYLEMKGVEEVYYAGGYENVKEILDKI